MFRKPFIQRSCQTIARSLDNKAVRRAMLSALIAGSSFASLPSAQASDSDNRGGISILVHEFMETSDAPESIEKEAVAAQVSTDASPSPGTHDSAPVAEKTQTAYSEVAEVAASEAVEVVASDVDAVEASEAVEVVASEVNAVASSEVDEAVASEAAEVITSDVDEAAASEAAEVIASDVDAVEASEAVEVVASDVDAVEASEAVEVMASEVDAVASSEVDEAVASEAAEVISSDVDEAAASEAAEVIASEVAEVMANEVDDVEASETVEVATSEVDEAAASEVAEVMASEVDDVVASETVEVMASEVDAVASSEVDEAVASEAAEVIASDVDAVEASEAVEVVASEVDNVEASEAAEVVASEVDAVASSEVAEAVASEVDDVEASETVEVVASEVDAVASSEVDEAVASEVTEVMASDVDEAAASEVAEVMASEVDAVASSEVAEAVASEVDDVEASETVEVVASEVDAVAASEVAEVMPSEVAEVVAGEIDQLGASEVDDLDVMEAAETAADEVTEVVVSEVASDAKLGISIEQVLEPFAMVGPIAEEAPTAKQLAESVALNRWWLDTETVAIAKPEADEIVEAIAKVVQDDSEMKVALDELATEEPLDVEAVDFQPSDEKLVGSSPVIVTVQDAYMPYDLAQRDLELNWLPLSTVVPLKEENYVLKPDTNEGEADPAEVAIGEVEPVGEATVDVDMEELAPIVVVHPENMAVNVAETEVKASPECLLESLAHQTSKLAQRAEAVDFTFARLGESFGDWVASLSEPRTEIAKDVAPVSMAEASVEPIAPLDEGSVEIASVVVGSAVVCPSECEVAIESQAVEAIEDVKVAVSELAVSDVAMMEIDGQTIPAPVADPIPNGEPQERIASSDTDEDLAFSEPVTMESQPSVDSPKAETSIDDLIVTISQWQREAIRSILASELAAQDEPAAEVAEKVEVSSEAVLR